MKKLLAVCLSLVFLAVCLGLVFKFIPLSIAPQAAITVTGEARQDLQVQVARFTVGATAENSDKQTAINQVNNQMTGIIQQVKDFGIEDKHVQTQTVSVNQYEDRSARLLWRAENSIEIILEDVSRASDLADLLNSTEATNVYGPRFSLEETTDAETQLLTAAIDNAREKAAKIASASDRRLGKVLNVEEGGVSSPITPFLAAERSTITPIEPGSEALTKTVTVTFELK